MQQQFQGSIRELEARINKLEIEKAEANRAASKASEDAVKKTEAAHNARTELQAKTRALGKVEQDLEKATEQLTQAKDKVNE